jgi:hypothetical protein
MFNFCNFKLVTFIIHTVIYSRQIVSPTRYQYQPYISWKPSLGASSCDCCGLNTAAAAVFSSRFFFHRCINVNPFSGSCTEFRTGGPNPLSVLSNARVRFSRSRTSREVGDSDSVGSKCRSTLHISFRTRTNFLTKSSISVI